MNFSWSLVTLNCCTNLTSPPPFALAFNPPQSWMKSMNLSRVQPRCRNATSAGYLRSPSWSRCHLPWVAVWRAFTLLNACSYICHRIGLSCTRCLIGWGCHQSYAAELGLAFGSMVRLGSDLGLISPIKSKLHIVWKVGLNSTTYGWVFMRALKSST